MKGPVPEVKRALVVKRWVEGLLSTRTIAAQEDIKLGSGTVSEIIGEARKKQPDIDELRSLNKKLKEDRGYSETLRTANVLHGLEKEGLEAGPDALIAGAKIVKAHSDDYEEVIAASIYAMSLEQAQKKPLPAIVADAREMIARADRALQEYDSLNRRIEVAQKELVPLEGYRRLEKDLEEMQTSVAESNGFFSFHRRLRALGFGEEAALGLANELQKWGLTPAEAASELAEALKKHSTLRAANDNLESERKRLEISLRVLNAKSEGLEDALKKIAATVGKLDDSVVRLKEAVTGVRESTRTISEEAPLRVSATVEQIQRDIRETGKEVLEALNQERDEISSSLSSSAKRVSDAASSVESEASKAEKSMKRTSESIAGDMDRLQETALKVGGEVVRLEPIATAYRVLAEGKGEPADVMPIAFQFLHNFLAWEKGHYQCTTYYLERAIGETLENWEKPK